MTQRPHPRLGQPGLQRPQQLGHVAVRDRHTFGHPGGARGVNQVGDVVRGRPRQIRVRLGVDGGIVDVDDRHAVAVESLGQRRGGDRRDRRGIGEHEADPLRGQTRVDRQIRRPRLEHRHDRRHRLDRPRQHHRHRPSRPRPPPNEQVRQPIRGLIHLPIRQRQAITDHRHGIRNPGHLGGEQFRHRHRNAVRNGQNRLITKLFQASALTHTQHIHRRQPPTRIGGHRHQHPLQPTDQRQDAVRVEHVGAKFDLPRNPGGLTGVGPAFFEEEDQIHFRGLGVPEQRRDLKVTQAQPGRGDADLSREVVPAQHHLDQRVVGQRSGGVEPLDEYLERHVLVLVGGQAA